MFLVTIYNSHTKQVENYFANALEMGEQIFSTTKENESEVHIFYYRPPDGVLGGRKDACKVISTTEPVRVEPWAIQRPDGY
jgi:hypothetical protein